MEGARKDTPTATTKTTETAAKLSPPLLQQSLIDVDESVLVVIDVQDAFVKKLHKDDQQQPLVDRIAWLIRIAKQLKVPIVVTAEDIPTLGGVVEPIAKVLPPDTTIHNKLVFGLVQDEGQIMTDIAKTGRKTAILVGLETDVCVTHSALGLQQVGYQVAVVDDATGSPGKAHTYGIDRMKGAGVTIVSTKGLYFEWVRTVARDNEFQDLFPPPNGLVL